MPQRGTVSLHHPREPTLVGSNMPLEQLTPMTSSYPSMPQSSSHTTAGQPLLMRPLPGIWPLPSQILWLTRAPRAPFPHSLPGGVCVGSHTYTSPSPVPPSPGQTPHLVSDEHTQMLTWSSQRSPPASGTVELLSRAQAYSTSRLSPFQAKHFSTPSPPPVS